MNIPIQCIIKAFQNALIITKNESIQDNKERSSCFIKELHKVFEIHYSQEQGYAVFSREIENTEFHRSEYLFDLLVGTKKYVPSSVHDIKLPYIERAIVVVESEFGQNNRDSVIDFNKLTLARADIKIMILPYSGRNDECEHYLAPLSHIVNNSEEIYFAVFIPHPSMWDKVVPGSYKCYQLQKNSWTLIAK